MLVLKLCALCLATGAAAKSIASQVKESDVSPEGDFGEPDSPSGPPEARRPPMAWSHPFATLTSIDNHPHAESESMSDARYPSMPRQLLSVPIPKPVTWFAAIRPRSAYAAVGVLTLLAVVSILGMMWQPGGAGNNARLPPR